MNESNVRQMIGELASRQVPHLTNAIAHAIANEFMVVRQPAEAVVVNLGTIHSKAWGTCHEFSTIDTIEVYR